MGRSDKSRDVVGWRGGGLSKEKQSLRLERSGRHKSLVENGEPQPTVIGGGTPGEYYLNRGEISVLDQRR